MANLLNVSSIEYTVKNQPEYFVKAIRNGRTLSKDYIRVIPNVTKETKVKKLVMTGGTVSQVDGRDCAWTPVQRMTISDKLMEVNNFKINEEQCLDELDNLYSEMLYTSGATKTEMPEGLEGVIMATVQTALSNDIEKIIWGGAGNEVDGIQDGIVDKASADSDVLTVSGTTLNNSNILTEIAKVYDKIPNEVLSEGYLSPEGAPVRIFVDMNAFRMLRTALGTTPTDYQVLLPNWTIDGDRFFYLGVEVVVVGLPENVMVAGSKDNMVFLTDLLSDTISVKAEQGKSLKDENIFYIKGQYRANADYIFSDEIVLYTV